MKTHTSRVHFAILLTVGIFLTFFLGLYWFHFSSANKVDDSLTDVEVKQAETDFEMYPLDGRKDIRWGISNRVLYLNGEGDVCSLFAPANYEAPWPSIFDRIEISGNISALSGQLMFDSSAVHLLVNTPTFKTVSLQALQGSRLTCADFSQTALEEILPYAFSGAVIDELHLPASLRRIAANAFCDASIGAIYFHGSSTEFSSINIDSQNNDGILNNANVICIADMMDTLDYNENILWGTIDGTMQVIGIGSAVGGSGGTAFNWRYDNTTETVETLYVGGSIQYIGPYAFVSLNSVKTAYFASPTLQYLGMGLFTMCNRLEEVNLQQTNLRNLPMDTFYACPNLTTVYLPSTLTKIDSYAFDDCPALSRIIFEGTEAEWAAITVEAGNEALDRAQIICLGEGNP